MLQARVLVAEDDRELRELLVRGLARHELEVAGVATGGELLAETERWRPDALVVDIGLPDADGRDVCQALRARGAHLPVLFLTARDTRADRLAGFASGGDDYVTKPFDFAEVVARLQALLRRAGATPGVQVGGLRLDPLEHTAACGDEGVPLTPTEFRLLAALAAQPGDAVRRRALVAAAWPQGAIVHDNTLDVYIARLRRKLGGLPGAPRIVTVHGVGYSLR
jgi:two-component system, OmpR family, response regulator